MKRKVNRVGQNTLTISLPSKWAKKNNIKQGDELDLFVERNKITVVNGTYKRKKKEIKLSLDKLDYFSLTKILIACYEEGYDSITLTFSKNTVHDYVPDKHIDLFTALERIIGRLVTFEVVDQSNKKVVIEDISEKLVKLDTIILRVFFLLEEYLKCLVDDIKTNNKDDLNARESRHDTIAKYAALANRILLDEIDKSITETLNTFLVINLLDKSADFIRYAYKHTQKSKKAISKPSLRMMEKSLEYLRTYRKFFGSCDHELINKLDKLRSDTKRLFSKVSNEKPSDMIIVSNLKCMVEMMNGAVKPVIAINLSAQ